MNAPVPLTAWLQVLAVIAAEVGLIGVAVAALRRWSPTAAWGRTFCHAGIIAVLAVTGCELSGSARVFSRWAASAVSSWIGTGRSAPSELAQPELGAARAVDASTQRQQVAAGILPAVEGGILPPVTLLDHFSTEVSRGSIPPGRMPGSTAGRMPAAATDSAWWLWPVWVLGAAIVGGRVLLGRGLFVLFQLRRRRATDPLIASRVLVLAGQLGIRRRVRVIESGRLTSPIAFGFLCPTVGLPADFAKRFDAAKQDSMLAHELAHLAAHDTFWCLLADAAVAVLWWHPGAWWLRRQLHLASEMAADEASLLVADGPRVLAECLVELGTRLAAPALLGQLRVSGFRSHLGRRVQQLVLLEGRAWSPPPRVAAAATRILGPVVMTAAVVLCTAWAAPQALTKGESMKMMQLSWKRSLASVALFAAFNGPDATLTVAQAENPSPPPAVSPAVPPGGAASPEQPQAAQAPAAPQPPALPSSVDKAFLQRYGIQAPGAVEENVQVRTLVQDAKRLYEVGKMEEAGAKLRLALKENPRSQTALYYLSLVNESKYREALNEHGVSAPPAPPAAAPNTADGVFPARYGLAANTSAPEPTGSPRPSESPARGAKVEAKLKQMTLEEVKFDGLPLNEVLLYLNDQSRKLDPDKHGINFLINPNARPVAMIGGVDPTTGLPLAAGTQTVDVGSVEIKFNMPLRNVTMKDVLDAIVTVADHPIEYSLEDYGVVFAVKPETLEGQPVALAPAAMTSVPARPSQSQNPFVPRLEPLASAPGQPVEPPRKPRKPSAELLDVKPEAFNVDFGGGNPSDQVGPAAVGKQGDFWNAVTMGSTDHHTEGDLSFANHEPSPIEVEMVNLGGSWSFHGAMGVKSPMMDHYNYPAGNKGGNSQVILHNVPAGKYYVYVYGHGPHAPYFGDYTLSVGGRDYGRKQTSEKAEAGKFSKWVEGIQYVKFSNVKVGAGEDMDILIRPGGQVSDGSGRTFSDAMISGLQLIPMK